MYASKNDIKQALSRNFKTVDRAEYFSTKGLSASLLGAFLRSRPEAMAQVMDLLPERKTPSMTRGSAHHCMILEGSDAFYERYVIAPEGYDGRKKEWREWRESDEARGRTIIKNEDGVHITMNLLAASSLIPGVVKEINAGISEYAITGFSKRFVHPVRCMYDNIALTGWINELKTFSIQGETDAQIRRDFFRYKYDIKAMWYVWLYNQAFGHWPKGIRFIFMSQDIIPIIRVFSIPTEVIRDARESFVLDSATELDKLFESQNFGLWHGEVADQQIDADFFQF